jgi:hypothetical protein
MKNLRIVLWGLLVILGFSCKSDSVSVVNNAGSTGTGGSMARFTIMGDYLYVVDNNSLKTYNISNTADPVFVKKHTLGTTVETIFPFKEHLLVGTMTGMYIYSVEKPESPVLKSVYNHVVACDPVVADGKYAYVTLRGGTNCRRAINALDVIDISDMNKPSLVKSFPMENPHGLGVDGKYLFVCEGDFGLKIFDKTNPISPKEIANYKEVRSFDVIPNNNSLIVTGKDGILQYAYNEKNEVKLLSKIEAQL